MNLTRKLKITGLIFFIVGFLLTYFSWWQNDYMPNLFFVIVGFALWLLGITIYFAEKDKTFQIVFVSVVCTLVSFFILTFATQWYFLKENYSFIRAHLFTEPVKWARPNRTYNNSVTSIYYKAGGKEIKKAFAGDDYQANDFVLIKYSNSWPEIYETLAKVPDSLILIEDVDELKRKLNIKE